MHRGKANGGQTVAAAAAAAAATVAWCNSRGNISGHSMHLNVGHFYSGLFGVGHDLYARESMSRDSLSRLNLNSKPNLLLFQAIRCTHTGCPCECFAPGKQSLRHCDTCSHGWVAHGKSILFNTTVQNTDIYLLSVYPYVCQSLSFCLCHFA